MNRCLRNHYIKFGGKPAPRSQKTVIFYTPKLSNWQPYFHNIIIVKTPQL